MKKFVLGFILGALLFSIIPASAVVQEYVLQKSDVRIMVDGEEHADKELPVLNYKGYNYLPAAAFRGICDKIGVGFNWDNAKKEIQITAVGQAKEGDNVSEDTVENLKTYEKDGLPFLFLDYEGKTYILNNESVIIPIPYQIVHRIRMNNGVLQLTKWEPDSIKIIIDNIPYINPLADNPAYIDDYYIDYEFYLNNIAPVFEDNKGE